jgi:hypothetical protein
MPRVTHKLGGAIGVASISESLHNLMDNTLLDDLTATYRVVHSAGCRAILLRSSQRRSAPTIDQLEVAVGLLPFLGRGS